MKNKEQSELTCYKDQRGNPNDERNNKSINSPDNKNFDLNTKQILTVYSDLLKTYEMIEHSNFLPSNELKSKGQHGTLKNRSRFAEFFEQNTKVIINFK